MLKLIFLLFYWSLIMDYWIMCNMIAILTLMLILFFNKNLLMVGYMMEIDMISFGLIMLSIWITFLMYVYSINYNNKMFLFLLLLLMLLLILSFSSSNLIMFYIFF